MIVYRVEREEFLMVWPSEGYRHDNGRWHQMGFPIVYTADNGPLAMLEALANSPLLPKNRFLVEIKISDKVTIYEPAIKDLPDGWDKTPYTEENWDFVSGLIGDGHICIKVPSIQAPVSFNYLLFAGAKDFKKIFKINRTIPLPFDSRLKGL